MVWFLWLECWYTLVVVGHSLKLIDTGSRILCGDGRTYHRISTDQFDGISSTERTFYMDWLLFCYFLLVEDIILHVHYKLYYSTWKTPLKPLFQLVSTIFYFCTLLLIAFQKLWKMPFLSSKKLFLFSKYSNFCNIWSPFPHFAIQKDNWSCENISGIQLYNKQYN